MYTFSWLIIYLSGISQVLLGKLEETSPRSEQEAPRVRAEHALEAQARASDACCTPEAVHHEGGDPPAWWDRRVLGLHWRGDDAHSGVQGEVRAALDTGER